MHHCPSIFGLMHLDSLAVARASVISIEDGKATTADDIDSLAKSMHLIIEVINDRIGIRSCAKQVNVGAAKFII